LATGRTLRKVRLLAGRAILSQSPLMWIRRLFLLTAVCAALWPAMGLAEGSCTWNDVMPVLDAQPGLRRFLEDSFAISPGGSAMRLSKQFESLEGRRVGPYRFDATSRKDSKLVFELVIETKAEFIDDAGTLLPPGQESAGVVVRERFAAIRLEPVTAEAGPAQAMPEPQSPNGTAWTQARLNQLNLGITKFTPWIFRLRAS